MAEIMALDGEWRLYHWPEGMYALHHPDQLGEAPVLPILAQVPGNVELDLIRAGLLPDPFFADNIRLLRILETHEWWYCREFVLPLSAAGKRWRLVFDGLDTLATIWVNGEEVGRTTNMLIEHSFEITPLLMPGKNNRISVHLGSALNAARQFHYDAASMSWEGREEGLFIRKAPHVWGWDIMPRAVSTGIWRSVRLEEYSPNAIEQLYYWTVSVDAQDVVLGVRYQFRTDAPDYEGMSLRFHGECSDHHFDFTWPVEFLAGGCRIPLHGARLWQPRGYGEANIYSVTAQLCRGEEALSERKDRIGIRKLELQHSEKAGPPWSMPGAASGVVRSDRSPNPESHFYITVNEEPIFIKGANWVPLDAFHSRDAGRLEPAVDLFADLGCNMIRCWGGNVYEDHRFFELCDQKGILVWQDFSFACCRYPQTEDFLAQVRQEVQAVVEKLRNHPSLALWCGDNEIDMVYLSDGLSPRHNRLTREVIPQVLQRSDPYRPYLPSSPYVPPALEGKPEAWQLTVEQHMWGPRGYFKSPFYTQHNACFIGEIGYHGCPNVSSLPKFLSPDKIWPWQNNEEWQAHSVYHWKHTAIQRDRIALMANQVRELFGFIPGTLEDFVLASQITQAEAKKFFVESTRLRKWRTSGILWWNVIDGWPQFSDAVVDYYFGKKLAYHYLWRVQRPVCLVVGEAGAGKYLPVIVCNDTHSTVEVQYRLWEAESKETLLEGAISAPANQNWQVGRLRAYASDQRLYLLEWKIKDELFGNHYTAGSPPFSLERYRRWLLEIASLPRPFDWQAGMR